MTPLVLTQHVPAPPAHVYAAWLSAEGLARWWWVSIGDTTYEVADPEGVDGYRQSWEYVLGNLTALG